MTTENKPAHDMTLTRIFDAPRALVFKAWTDPGHLAQWWGPHGFTNPRCEADPRPGGLIHIDMRAPDGTVYPMPGAYREVVEPERLVFTAGALGPDGTLLFEILNTVTFAENEGKTTVTLHTRVLTAKPGAEKHLEGQEIGWSQSLERLAVMFSNEPFVIERTFDAPADLVWKAITEKDRMKEWFFTIEDFVLEPGCEFHFSVEHQGMTYDHRCKVTEVIPGTKLAFTWRYEGYEGDSLVTFELFPEGEKTLLRLTHEGLGTFPKLPSFARGNFTNGWTMLIGTSLRDYLNPKD
jgi:uncharacterized protein YndB with AHSA1/START domain